MLIRSGQRKSEMNNSKTCQLHCPEICARGEWVQVQTCSFRSLPPLSRHAPTFLALPYRHWGSILCRRLASLIVRKYVSGVYEYKSRYAASVCSLLSCIALPHPIVIEAAYYQKKYWRYANLTIRKSMLRVYEYKNRYAVPARSPLYLAIERATLSLLKQHN